MRRSKKKPKICGQITGFLSPFLEDIRIRKVIRFIDKNSSILDIGCGSATILKRLSDIKFYMGIDVIEDVIKYNKKMYPEFEFACINIEEESPNRKDWDNILLLAIIEHLASPQDILIKLKNLLNKDGKIIITTPAPIGKNILKMGAKLGIFSKEAEDEHQTLLSKEELFKIAAKCNLKVDHFGMFLFGMNQIMVLRKW